MSVCRQFRCSALLLAVLLATLATACHRPKPYGVFELALGSTPPTQLELQNQSQRVQFALIGDRTGGQRPGVFDATIAKLNLLQPEFVISVGDLIEGYTEDPEELRSMWAELDQTVSKLDMPFLAVPGNHDMGNEVMRQSWRERNGRDYYYFVYKNVLFLMLNTEDPPVELPAKTLEQIAYFKKIVKEDPVLARELVANNPKARNEIDLPVAISDTQVDYFREVLEQHSDVRWTFFIMHKPAWEYDAANFERIEALAQDRPYTMFAGHQHNYVRTERYGRDYIRLGTSAGIWHHEGKGNMDHITWTTLTDDGPIITNLLLNGILDKNGPTDTTECREFHMP